MATKVRIQFSVGVVTDPVADGEKAPVHEHERFITFGDDIAPSEIRGFFERCGLSVHNLFGSVSMPVAIRLKSTVSLTTHKIQAIKALRTVSNHYGLKEAKDIIEGSFNGAILPYMTIGWCYDDGTAEKIVHAFRTEGVEVEISRNVNDVDGVRSTVRFEHR